MANDFWSTSVAIVRSLLALSLIGTLISNDSFELFLRSGLVVDTMNHLMMSRVSFFGFFGSEHVDTMRILACAFLSIVAIGFSPRWTCIVHWWITTSFAYECQIVQGGDQVAAILTLLLLPICLSDNRWWQWSYQARQANNPYLKVTLDATIVLIRLQVSMIYFQACTAKFAVEEWSQGTAAYYWFNMPSLGMSSWLASLLNPVLATALGVVLLTWLPLVLEGLLATALFWNRYRTSLFVLGVGFHLSIAVVFGLSSFGVSMSCALILYLLPWKQYDLSKAWVKIQDIKNAHFFSRANWHHGNALK